MNLKNKDLMRIYHRRQNKTYDMNQQMKDNKS